MLFHWGLLTYRNLPASRCSPSNPCCQHELIEKFLRPSTHRMFEMVRLDTIVNISAYINMCIYIYTSCNTYLSNVTGTFQMYMCIFDTSSQHVTIPEVRSEH